MENRTDAHGGHRNRLRQRVLSEGLEGLEPHEIIEFLLCYAIPRQDVNDLAHALIRRFGSVKGVLNAEMNELTRVEGVGRRTAQFLMLMGEAVSACAVLRPEDKPSLSRYVDVFRFALSMRRRVVPPASVQLLMDVEGRLLFRRELCPSLSWGEAETMREALGDVMRMSARSAIILLYVGTMPVRAQAYDEEHARNYAYTLHAADCELLDVVIVGEEGVDSMRRYGLIPDLNQDERMRMVREDYARGLMDNDALDLKEILPRE